MLVTFHPSNPTFRFEQKLQNFTLVVVPFRRIKRTNEQSLHWSFGFIEISPLAPSTQSKIQKITLIILVSHTRPLKFISTPRKAKHFVGQWIRQLMTASNVSARTQAWQAKWAVFKIQGFVCKRFFPFLPTPSPFFYLRHFLRSRWLSFLILCSKTKQKRLLRRPWECQKSKRFNEVNMTLIRCVKLEVNVVAITAWIQCEVSLV